MLDMVIILNVGATYTQINSWDVEANVTHLEEILNNMMI